MSSAAPLATGFSTLGIGDDMEIDLSPSAATTEDTSAKDGHDNHQKARTGDGQTTYAEDVNLIYMEVPFPCNTALLRQGSGVFKKLLEGYVPNRANPGSFNVARYVECDCPEVFFAVLGVIYGEGWTCPRNWEQEMSYLSYVKLWLMGHHWDMAACKSAAVEGIEHTTTRIMYSARTSYPAATAAAAAPCRQLAGAARGAHLASFVRALRLANRRPWHSRLWKPLYDAGERLAPRLRRAAPFAEYVRGHRDGADFARAIGMRKV